jgi:hypothetical protein
MPALKRGGALNERVSASLHQLSSSAADLNRFSDELGAAVKTIDKRLNQLKLGVSAWATFAEYHDEDRDLITCHQIGYTRLPVKGFPWGMAIRTVVSSPGMDADEEVVRAFTESPRDLRLKSICAFPDLIDTLTKEVETKISEIAPGVEQMREFESALTSIIGITDDEVPF